LDFPCMSYFFVGHPSKIQRPSIFAVQISPHTTITSPQLR
jgi:hypothetical protein